MIHLLQNAERIQRFKDDMKQLGVDTDKLAKDPSVSNPWIRDLILIQLVGMTNRQTILIEGLLRDINILKEEIEDLQSKQK